MTENLEAIDARAVNSIEIPGSDIVVRVGRYGPYLQRGEQRASLPDDSRRTSSVPATEELLAQPGPRSPRNASGDGERDRRQGPVRAVRDRGPAEGEDGKPRTASLFSSMSPETISLDDALRLLMLPRTWRAGRRGPVSNGRYGPYVKRGSDSRSLECEEQLFTVTLEQAEALLAEPKPRRGRGAAKPPLKELGADPSSGRALVVKDGRFGPYVTDGETNASLRRGDSPEAITLERAAELLAERRAKSE